MLRWRLTNVTQGLEVQAERLPTNLNSWPQLARGARNRRAPCPEGPQKGQVRPQRGPYGHTRREPRPPSGEAGARGPGPRLRPAETARSRLYGPLRGPGPNVTVGLRVSQSANPAQIRVSGAQTACSPAPAGRGERRGPSVAPLARRGPRSTRAGRIFGIFGIFRLRRQPSMNQWRGRPESRHQDPGTRITPRGSPGLNAEDRNSKLSPLHHLASRMGEPIGLEPPPR